MENTSIDENLLLKKCGFIMETASIDEYLLLKYMWLHRGKHSN